MSKAATVTAKLIVKKQLTADVIELHFDSNPTFSFQPGQFISVVIPGRGPGGRDLRRAYSIASHPEKSVFELCVKVVDGPGTQYLNALEVGQSITGMVPFGDFVYKTKPNRHAIMIATGTGIAPFRSMVFSEAFANSTPLSTKLLFGARDQNDLIYTEEFAKKLGSGFVQTLSRSTGDWAGFKGRVTDWIRAHEAKIDFATTDFYLCGNGAMIDEMKLYLASKGLDKSSIFQEAYYKPKAGETHASQG